MLMTVSPMTDIRTTQHPPLIWDIAVSFPVGTLLADADERVIFANPAWSALTGMEEGESTGDRWRRVLSSRDARTAQRLLRAAVRNGTGGNARFRIETPRGPAMTVWHVAPHRVALDDCRAVIVVHEASRPASPIRRSDSEPTQAELLDMLDGALRSAMSRHELVGLITVGVDDIDEIRRQRGNAVAAGVAAAVAERVRSTMRPHDLRSKLTNNEIVILCTDLPGEEAAARVGARLNQALTAPVVVGDSHVTVRPSIGVATGSAATDDPTTVWFRSNAAMEAARASGGGVVVRGHKPVTAPADDRGPAVDPDLVDALEQRVEEQARLIGELAHVLNSSFAVLRGWADMLLQRWSDLDDSTRLHGVDAIRHESDDVVRLAQALLKAAPAERSNLDLVRVSTDVGALVEEVVRARRVADPELRVELEIDRPLADVVTDPGMVRIILDELLDNAIKYSSSGVPVTVHVRPSGDSDLLIDVVDEGIELAGDIDPFEPFVRGTGTDHVAGTGLGLYIAKRVAARIGADLTAHQRSNGARFALWLPISPDR